MARHIEKLANGNYCYEHVIKCHDEEMFKIFYNGVNNSKDYVLDSFLTTVPSIIYYCKKNEEYEIRLTSTSFEVKAHAELALSNALKNNEIGEVFWDNAEHNFKYNIYRRINNNE